MDIRTRLYGISMALFLLFAQGCGGGSGSGSWDTSQPYDPLYKEPTKKEVRRAWQEQRDQQVFYEQLHNHSTAPAPAAPPTGTLKTLKDLINKQ